MKSSINFLCVVVAVAPSFCLGSTHHYLNEPITRAAAECVKLGGESELIVYPSGSESGICTFGRATVGDYTLFREVEGRMMLAVEKFLGDTKLPKPPQAPPGGTSPFPVPVPRQPDPGDPQPDDPQSPEEPDAHFRRIQSTASLLFSDPCAPFGAVEEIAQVESPLMMASASPRQIKMCSFADYSEIEEATLLRGPSDRLNRELFNIFAGLREGDEEDGPFFHAPQMRRSDSIH